MNWKKVKQDIMRHEGYRDSIYIDTVGVPTGGYGHAFHEGSKLPDHIWESILSYDLSIVLEDHEKFISVNGLYHLNEKRQEVLFNMMFNLGYTKLSKFKKFIAAMQGEDFHIAAIEMLDSKWAEQVGVRAIELSDIMRRGV